jgi:hypothetical protein
MIDPLDDPRVRRTQLLLRLFVRSTFTAKPAVFIDLNTLRFFLFVFGAVVIETIANCTLEMDDFAHFSNLLYGLKVKAPDRFRTGDLVLTKDVLYRLSYRGKNIKLKYI